MSNKTSGKPRKEYRRPYRINPYERAAHDPWGNKRGNKGGIINFQYQVAQAEIMSYYETGSVNKMLWGWDKSKMLEHNHGRFMRTNNRVEKLRK